MIEIGEIALKDPESVYAAAEKIRAVALDLSLSGFVAARLATLTTELSRLFSTDRMPVRVRVAIDDGTPKKALVLLFEGKGVLPANRLAGLEVLCDSLTAGKGPRSLSTVDVRQMLSSSSVALDAQLTADLKRTVEEQTLVEELYAELREKHAELKKHIRRLEKREEQLFQSRKQLREMTVQIVLAEEQERKRLAVGLHDFVLQSLSATSVKARVLEDMLSSGEAADLLHSIREELNTAAQALRTLTFELSPPILYELGLGAALEWLGEQLHRQGIDFEFAAQEEPPGMHESVKTLLFQCARELIANVRKHAEASHVTLSQTVNGKSIIVTVEDDGKGFDSLDVAAMSRNNSSFGLLSVRERLRQVGGTLDLASEPGAGATATMSVPLSGKIGMQSRKRRTRKA